MAGGSAALRHGLLLAVIGAGFVLAPEPVWAMSFYLLVLPGQLWRLRQARGRLTAGEAVAVALIAWLGVATVWDRSGAGHALWLFNAGCTVAFVLACAEMRGRDLASVMIAGGVVNAALAAWRGPERPLRLALLVLVLGVGMTDLSNLAKGPSPMWYVVWVPLVLSLNPQRGLLGGRAAAS